tara:strand:+ start:1387 stop:3231 length:1845 start_codon:yes stop_codon:yes gene_type:complete
MAYKVRSDGNLTIGFCPTNAAGTNLAGSFNENGAIQRANHLKSVNDPLRYQIQWHPSGYTEATESSSVNYDSSTQQGDLASVIFEVKVRPHNNVGYVTLGSIRKQKDILNKKYNDQSPSNGHRFTVDVSRLVQNELSYSLCPINKGTWQTRNSSAKFYGGMNGGAVMQDNVLGNDSAYGDSVSHYNISHNGTVLELLITASFEIINGDGEIVEATGTTPKNFPLLRVINSVNLFERDDTYYFGKNSIGYMIDRYSGSSLIYDTDFLSRCPNSYYTEPSSPFKKPVRMDEEAEFLQFYIRTSRWEDIEGTGSSSGDDLVGNMALKVTTYDSSGIENVFYMRDFEDNLDTFTFSGRVHFENNQEYMFVQNISPYYINNTTNLIGASKTNPITHSFPYWVAYTGNRITANTLYYRVECIKIGFWPPYNERRVTRYRYYVIDREDAKTPYEFVRFHWLNSLGGIDSYTAKRDVVEALTVSRDTVERKSVDRTWMQSPYSVSNGDYISDTMRGGDIYKGGREVTNVNAEKTRSVYTEPLNSTVSGWLQEIFLSPNVWIEMDTEATQRPNHINPYLRPSTKGYIPVIITNSDVETVNQEAGLVKFNIEYTLAHKVVTQRN